MCKQKLLLKDPKLHPNLIYEHQVIIEVIQEQQQLDEYHLIELQLFQEEGTNFFQNLFGNLLRYLELMLKRRNIVVLNVKVFLYEIFIIFYFLIIFYLFQKFLLIK
mgnify:CR=1 FL=1